MKNHLIFATVFLFLKSSISAFPALQEDDVPNISDESQQTNSAFKRHIRRVTPYILSNLFTTQHEPLPSHQLNVIIVSQMSSKSETLRGFLDDGLDEQCQSTKTFLEDIVKDFANPIDIYTSPLISIEDVDALNIPNINEVYEDARLFEKTSEDPDTLKEESLQSFLEDKAQEILRVHSFHQSILLEWAERNYDEMNVIILASPLWSLLWQTIACKKAISDIDLHYQSPKHENRFSIKLFQKKKGTQAFQ